MRREDFARVMRVIRTTSTPRAEPSMIPPGRTPTSSRLLSHSRKTHSRRRAPGTATTRKKRKIIDSSLQDVIEDIANKVRAAVWRRIASG